MFVWVFFENLGKGLYTTAGYANLINYYIKASHSPAAWKAIMGLAASHAAMAAPLQAMTEISLGTLLVVGLLTRPVGVVDLGAAGSHARIACARGRPGRSNLGRGRLAGAAPAVLSMVVI
jgi:hypothetical protein